MLALLAQVAPDADAVEQALPQGLGWADWLRAGVVFVGGLVLAGVAHRVIQRALRRRSEGSATLVGRIVALIVATVGFVYALSSIGVEVGLLIGALGIGGIALAFAFQDILENFVAGIILQLKRPFRMGHIVEAGEGRHLGTVRDVDSRSVILDTFSGERVILPAAEVLKSPIINWTARPQRRLAQPVPIHLRADPQAAIDAIEARLRTIPEVLPDPAPRVLLSGFGESAVELTAYVWYPAYGDLFWVQHRVVQEAKVALEEAGIEIPFPQRAVTVVPEDQPFAWSATARAARSTSSGSAR